MARPWRTARSLFIALSVAAAFVGADGTATAQRPIERQALTNRQPQLLERALAQLKPASGNQAHIYFVGFAGYGQEAVFKREVLAVRQLFDERFGTRVGRLRSSITPAPSTTFRSPIGKPGRRAAARGQDDGSPPRHAFPFPDVTR